MILSRAKRLTALILAAALAVLTGCASAGTASGTGDDYVEGTMAGTDVGTAYAADSVFSLNSSAAAGFNPYTTASDDNRLVDELVYENIFELDDSYNLSSRMITSYENVDGVYWYFHVDTSIVMHDGSTLTAKDAAYSLQQAQRSSRYSGRFSYVWGTSASSDEVFCVTLSQADLQFPYLLTVPVIKYGSIGEDAPAGTGPYKFAEDKSCLEVFDGYPESGTMPVDKVYLKEYTTTEETITAYEDSYIDLVMNDPSGTTNLGYGGNNETRYFTTTNMHFIGMNMDSDFLQYSNYRYALQFALDREYDTKTLMQGSAVASVLPVSPMSPLYNDELASQYGYDMDRCLLILNNSNVKDHDDDGKLEYLVTGIPMEISLDLIVCSESAGKADIAKKFAEDLGAIGLTVNVRELSWDDYVAALQDGDFDMYYGEIKLTPDFSLTRLLAVDGDLNYCDIQDETYGDYIAQYLAADDDMRQACCDIMLKYISDTAPIIPICFERQEVITHRNVVSGIDPSQYNIFMNFGKWTINFDKK